MERDKILQKKINLIFKIMYENKWRICDYNNKLLEGQTNSYFGRPDDIIKQLDKINDGQKEFMTKVSFDEYLNLEEEEKYAEEYIPYYFYEIGLELIEKIKEKVIKGKIKNTDIICIESWDEEGFRLLDLDECLDSILELYLYG